jgi:hypothetical protein
MLQQQQQQQQQKLLSENLLNRMPYKVSARSFQVEFVS